VLGGYFSEIADISFNESPNVKKAKLLNFWKINVGFILSK